MSVMGRGIGLDRDVTTTGAVCLSSLPQASHSGRGQLRQGDVTTPCPKCGKVGTLLEGERRMSFRGVLVALDGMLVHCGCPIGSNRLVAPVTLAADARTVTSSVPPVPASAQTPRPATSPRSPQSFTPSAPAQGIISSPAGGLEPGFYIVPKTLSWSQLLMRLTEQQGPQVITRLQRLNPTYQDGFKAGEIVVLGDPENFTACTREEADLMATAAQVRETLKQLSIDEANFMMRHQGEIAGLLGNASLSMGVGQVMLARGLREVEDILRHIGALHQREFRLHGHLKSPEFFAARRQLLNKLDVNLKTAFLNKALGLGSYDTLRRDLGISTKSVVHHWSKAGGAGQIAGYATHLDRVARVSKYLKYGGYVGIALGGTASALKVKEVCSSGDVQACEKVRFTEAGAFSGGLAGGALGAEIGALLAPTVCAPIAAVTMGVGGAVCGLIMVGGGSFVGVLGGDHFGEMVGDWIYRIQR
ncbi:hypothetical protein PS627_02055 [Pseudomonas fluorescens]|nr:hypothetical protein PS627_02055 [Pseudomonas fluorescens]